jgi:hypothetical protein
MQLSYLITFTAHALAEQKEKRKKEGNYRNNNDYNEVYELQYDNKQVFQYVNGPLQQF